MRYFILKHNQLLINISTLYKFTVIILDKTIVNYPKIMEMKDVFNNKFTDQASLTNDFLVPEVSNYLQINETEIEARAKKIIKSARSYNSYNAF